jgi:hypothetical protein
VRDIDLIWDSREGEYFWRWDWTGQIRLNLQEKFSFGVISGRPSAEVFGENKARLTDREIVICPGNHDLDRGSVEQLTILFLYNRSVARRFGALSQKSLHPLLGLMTLIQLSS